MADPCWVCHGCHHKVIRFYCIERGKPVEKSEKGLIFNIQRYCINDGPGVRTMIFLKGCPMNCIWCENPESINPKPQLAFYINKCINCGNCSNVCLENAIDHSNDRRIHWARCNNCGRCTGICPTQALKMIGEERTIEDILEIVLHDKVFYTTSNGGVTISGGEATFQFDFLLNLLTALKKEKLHVVLCFLQVKIPHFCKYFSPCRGGEFLCKPLQDSFQIFSTL